MQLGIRLHDIAPGTLEERLSIARQQGFKCGHLALTKVLADYPGNQALTPGYAMYLRKLFAKYDIDIAVLGNYKNLANPDAQQLHDIQQGYYDNIRFAAQLGAGVVGTETGAPNTSYTPGPECHTDEALGTFIGNLRPVVRCAEQFGVILAIEPVWKHIVYDSKRALAVLRAIDSPNLRIILDPVNLLGRENYADREQIIRTAIEDLGDYVAVVHLKDFRPKDDGSDLVSMACGTGLMDYTDIMRFIKQRKPYIHATLENTKPDNAVATREFIEKCYAEA